jgi:glucosyl-dolichyl phosphate glucuronosyltransferase
MDDEILVSIVICTYNRAELLRSAIESILVQEVPHDYYELIVVDNNSTDHTREIVEQLSAKVKNIHYVFEEKLGLSHARNCGWKEAQGTYVGYLDDDAKASPEWIRVALEISQQVFPVAFGGPYYPYYLSPKPAWYKDEYGSWVQGTQSRFITKNEYLVGGNLFIRRDLLEYLGGFDPNLGMKGNLLGYHEEIAFIEKVRLYQGDNCLYYDPRLRIEHLVRPEKMKWSWIVRQKYILARDYHYLFNSQKGPISIIYIVYRTSKYSLLLLVDLLFRVLLRDRVKYPCFQQYYYEHTTRYITFIGELAEQTREKVVHVWK